MHSQGTTALEKRSAENKSALGLCTGASCRLGRPNEHNHNHHEKKTVQKSDSNAERSYIH